MANPKHVKIVMQGKTVINQWRQDHPKQSLDLSWADLAKIDLSGANLTKADLSNTNLYRANLTGANLCRANLTEAHLIEAHLIEANLAGARLSNTKIDDITLQSILPFKCNASVAVRIIRFISNMPNSS